MAGRMFVTALTALCLASSVSAWPKRQTLTIETIQKQALTNALKVLDGTLSDGIPRKQGFGQVPTCTKENVEVRKEYGDLSKDEKLEYIRALNCLRTRPSQLPAGAYPGAKSRYDDFVVVHMNMTPSVHSTANFMHWHRYYIWAYERALKTECGFTGTQPYWNWGKYADLPASPIFDGSATSLGGQGEQVKHAGTLMGQPFKAGTGGGCVTKGPLGNLTVSLGPVMGTMDAALKIPPNPDTKSGFGNNPRCLRRDVNNNLVTTTLRPAALAAHIQGAATIGKFQDSLQNNGARGEMSIHASGHYSIWGDPGGDVFVSPGEPVFWLHHGQVDRHWWMWANYLDTQIKPRTSMYEGGTNWMSFNSPKGKPTDKQWLDVLLPASLNGVPSEQLWSTTAGPFCYVYQ